MAYSNEWLQLRSAEDAYLTCRYNLLQDKEGMIADLAKALATVDDKETALRLLLEAEPGAVVLLSLLPKIMDLAIDSSNINTIGLAREVLCHYKNESGVRADIQSLATAYLAENDEWHYRRIIELYKMLTYVEELAEFLLICQASDNLEIQEIADDFHRV